MVYNHSVWFPKNGGTAIHMRSCHPAQVEFTFSRCHVGPEGPLDPYGCASCEKTVLSVSIACAVLSASATEHSEIGFNPFDHNIGGFATQLHLSYGIDRY